MLVGTHSGKVYAVVVRTGIFAGSVTVALGLLGSSAALAQSCGDLPFAGSGAPPGAIGVIGTGLGAGLAVSGALSAANTGFLTQSTAFVSAPANPKPDSEGAGIWIRGVGGELTLNSNSQVDASLTIQRPVAGLNLTPGTFHDSTSCSAQFHQTFGGFQLGYDVAKLNVAGWNLTLGTTAGFLETSGSIVGGNLFGGAFNSTTQAPFVGTYGVATYGNFFVDGLIRADYFQTDLDSPTALLFNQKVDAHGFTAAASAGYNWKVPNSTWFIEPSAGVVWSKEKVNPVNVTSPVAGIAGTTQVNDIESIMGRVGVRVGTTVESSSVAWTPFAAVSVWHDFAGNDTGNFATCAGCASIVNRATFNPNNPTTFTPVSLSASTSTNNIGTFGQYSLGVSGAVKNTGWLGFARVDYRQGSEMHGLSATGGIRYQFTPTEILSTMPVKAKAPVLMGYPVNWTGWYAGVVGGATEYGHATQTFSDVQSDVMRPAGWLGGGTLGYNYQAGKWVVGVEGDIVGTNSTGSAQTAPLSFFINNGLLTNLHTTSEDSLDWIATVTGRLGYAWTPRSLLYVKAGGAFANEKTSITFDIIPAVGSFSASTARTGWTAGFGSEFALTDRWSIKAEFDWLDFGTKLVTFNDPASTTINSSLHIAEGKVGINYKFWP